MAALKQPTPNMDAVRAHWGAAAPQWVRALAEECDRSSQQKAAARLGRSGSLINQVLRHIYTGRYDDIEARVKGTLMGAVVTCPVLAEISLRECLEEQAKPYANTNPRRVKLYKACRAGCPNYRGKEGS